ncbi:MAG: hypothetical protein WCF67_25715, partial [Chitinophagaceae bacterium]
MNTPAYILDVPLPKSQDFRKLKEEGLEYIQQCSGNAWTNLNPSDPGITILDQLCFALTELGYCNDFELNDMLTDADGKLELKDQFYQPEEILTTAPVTINDYRKYLKDGIEEVNNAVIVPLTKNTTGPRYIYQCYLLIDPSIVDPQLIDNICRSAFFHLNKSRNLGELFLMPLALQPVD